MRPNGSPPQIAENMKDTTKSDYKAWVGKLVNECLPLELQKKLLTNEPLTREEALKFMNVVSLAGDAKRLSGESEIIAEVRRQGQLTRQEFRKSQRDPLSVKDKRPGAQRSYIDKAVRLYVKLHDIEGKTAASFMSCCSHYWQEAKECFESLAQFKNFTQYDYNNFYDISALSDDLELR